MTWFGPSNRAFVTQQVATPVLPLRYQYQNGAVNTVDFPNDFSFNITENFAYTTNPSPGNTQSLLVTQTGAGGGYQPATDFDHSPYGIDVSGYTGFTMAIRVQSAGPFQIFCHDINDVNIPAALNDLTEIAALPLNTWVTLTFPLAYIGCWGKKNYYKHCIRSNRGTSGDIIQLDNIGFVPGVSGFIEKGNGALEAGWADASTSATANYAFDPRTLNAGTGNGADGLYALSGSVPPPPYPQSTPVPSKPMLALSLTSSGGKWRANFAGGYSLTPYSHFSFGALPTKSGHAYLVQMYNTSGTAVGNAVNPAQYCPEDPGISTTQFAIYAIPMGAFGSLPTSIGGMSIQDTSGQTTNTIYFSNVGFFALPTFSTGGIADGASVTITGSGFPASAPSFIFGKSELEATPLGSTPSFGHNQFSANTTPGVWNWTRFHDDEDGAVTDAVMTTDGTRGKVLAHTRPGSNPNGGEWSQEGTCPTAVAPGGNKWMFKAWTRQNNTFYGDNPAAQNKMFRLQGATSDMSDTLHNCVITYIPQNGGTMLLPNSAFQGAPNGGGSDTFYQGTGANLPSAVDGVWRRVTIKGVTGTTGNNNGQLYFKAEQAGATIQAFASGAGTSGRDLQTQFGGIHFDGSSLTAITLQNGDFNGYGNLDFAIDDPLLQVGSFFTVEAWDTNNPATSTHWETCEITACSSSSVTVKFNKGGFTSGSTAWLVVLSDAVNPTVLASKQITVA